MIAVPIVAKTVEQALSDIGEANALADVIELRLDFLGELTETALEELINACKRPVIVSNLKKQEPIPEDFGEIERFFLFRKAIDYGAAYIETDFESEKNFLQSILNYRKRTRLIVSYHDFSGTAPRETLESVLKKQIATGADIVKIATAARSKKDNDIVLGLIPLAKRLGKDMIAYCMGEAGRQSAVDCVAKGSFLTYACLKKGKESAPGQMTIGEMRKALRLD